MTFIPQRFQRIIIIAAIILAAAAVIYIIFSDVLFLPQHDKKNPYEYDVQEFTKTNINQLCYDEVKNIPLTMQEPSALAVNHHNEIIVAGDHDLMSYDSTGKKLFASDVGTEVTCLNIDENNRIYLGARDHVMIYNPQGRQITVWSPINNNSVITSIAVTRKDVFVADAGNRVIWHFNASGKLINRLAEKNTSQGIPALIVPSPFLDIALDQDGFLWVANPGLHAFENFSYDGKLRSIWEKASMTIEGFCGCCNPTHFAFLSDGSFVTSEKSIVRVKIIKPTGEFLCVVAGPEQFDEGTIGLDLAVDQKERILVLDPKRRMVRIFAKKSEDFNG